MTYDELFPAVDTVTGSDFYPEVLHTLSQSVTALECGLELSLLNDTTVEEYCTRIESLLETAQNLRQRFSELRAMQDAANPGDTSLAVPIDKILAELRDGFAGVAHARNVRISVKSAQAAVFGNATRLHAGLFQLLDFLLAHTGSGGIVRVVCRPIVSGVMVEFHSTSGDKSSVQEGRHEAHELGLWLAAQIFRAAGGCMEIRRNERGDIVGSIRLSKAGGDSFRGLHRL